MVKKSILKGNEARLKLKKGIDTVADCVKVTLGPQGRNALLGRIGVSPESTNDGVSVARHIQLDDPFEEMGAMLVKEVSMNTDIKAGDGTTTSTVLLQSITDEVFKRLNGDILLSNTKTDVIKLKKELDSACEEVVSMIEKGSRVISEKEIYDVALVSVEYPHLAEIIDKVYKKVGKDGIVSVEDGYIHTEYEAVAGLEINAGYHSDYYINNLDRKSCDIENPHILVTNHNVTSITQVSPIANTLKSNGINELVLIAHDFSPDLLSVITKNKINGGFSVVCVKLPYYDGSLQNDVCALTGASFIDKKADRKLEDVQMSDIGTASSAQITSAKTFIVGGAGDPSKRVSELKEQLSKTISAFDRDKLEKRIAGLSGGVAIIRVGAETDNERTYFKKKVEDAVCAVQNALNSGVVRGGGLALKDCADKLDESHILKTAIVAPYKQIQENAGGHLDIPDNVLDATKTVVTGLKNACSVASTLLTTEVVIAEKHDTKKDTDEDK
jgi:chaperonin GroEL